VIIERSLLLPVTYEKINVLLKFSDILLRVCRSQAQWNKCSTSDMPRLKRYHRPARIAKWNFHTLLRSLALTLTASDAVLHSNGWRGSAPLVEVRCSKPLRVNDGAHELAKGKSHIKGIESF
jgi:hypothetical protein